MKYVSLDLETTSLVPDLNNILMASFIVEDTDNIKPLEELPHFTCFVHPKGDISGSALALSMNFWILDILSGRKENTYGYPILNPDELIQETHDFLDFHFGKASKNIIISGKNVASFDSKFLPENLTWRFSHKVIDPTSMFIDWKSNKLPGLSSIKKKLGLEEIVTHNAYDDALDIIRILRTQYGQKEV